MLRRDTYMDDILTGASNLTEARNIQGQLIDLCKAGGFPLRKWSSNSAELLSGIPTEHRAKRDLHVWHALESHATLGLRWHPSTDCFSIYIRMAPLHSVTKRSVLSLTSRIFDPLGWLAPAVVRAKIMFQTTWLRGVSWDTPLDSGNSRLWREFRDDLPRLEEIRIPRFVQLNGGNLEVHGFSDASERAYAAVVYARTVEPDGVSRVRLLSAKTRVAPLKQVTLPRLELCAATLLVRLVAHVRLTLDLSYAPVYLWSDSSVALGWIRGHPSKWKTYVANRVAEIQTTLPEAQWNHLPGKENPADCASRGVSLSELVAHPLWWSGPPWLLSESMTLPEPDRIPEDDLPEARPRVHATALVEWPEEAEELVRFSSLNRLLRVTAWCRRWLRFRGDVEKSANGSTNRASSGLLDASECDAARVTWIRVVQAEHYRSELSAITRGLSLPKSSSLIKLTPFIDSQSILRVGGRIRHALLAYDERHPVILPSQSHFTRLVTEACHRQSMHGGVQLTLGLIRQEYWIPRGRALVKSVLRRCLPCLKWRAAAPQQIMGDLPRPRVTPARPFLHTGVDYAGPIMLRTTKGRGHRAHKAFIAVFMCLSTKAVHLNVVSDYTSEAFLAALNSFISRNMPQPIQ